MTFRKPAGFLISAVLLASALLSGCGGSTTEKTTIPSNATIFFAHSAAFRNNTSSTLLTWGYNGFGQLGNGALETSTVATPVPNLGPARLVSTGGNHTLAVTFANVSSVYGWGWNRQGQIGPVPAPETQAHSTTPVRIALPGALAVNALAAGGVHSLAVVDTTTDASGAVTSGAVRAWGLNSSGELGDNSFVDRPAPVFAVFSSTTRTTPLGGIVAVAAGSSHSLALSGAPDPGKVYSWGLNDSGQLGRNTSATGSVPRNRAGLVQLGTGDLIGVSQVAAGGSTSFARRGNEVWFWGYNPVTRETSTTPTQIVIPATGAAATIVDISAGWDHLLMLAADQTVWGWGFNSMSQLGDGTTVSSATPVRVRFSASQIMTGVTKIIAFGNHSLARSNGVWFGWGDNANGQLANPISTNSIGFVTVPTRVNGL